MPTPITPRPGTRQPGTTQMPQRPQKLSKLADREPPCWASVVPSQGSYSKVFPLSLSISLSPSTLAVLGSLGFSQAHRSPSPSSLVVGRGVTSARSGYPQEFPLISADRAGGGSWLGGGSNWKISSAPKHILLLKASMQAL